MKKRELFLDIETYSEADIAACGAYKYIADPRFQILMISYAFDNEEVVTVDLAQGEEIPEELEEGLLDSDVI